jgi:hypothetical protein
MNQPNDRPNSIQDRRLADFTDQVLEGKVKQVEADVDEELLGLEKTILRLNQAFPLASLDEATIKQMQVRLNARMRREEQEIKKPFWKRWFEPQFRLQFAVTFIVAALLVIIATSPFSFTVADSSTTATALTPMKNSIVVVLAGAVLVLLWMWIKRRK